jgi:septal ring factor EnvC (AmiA/AmiB activator)
MMTSQLNCEQLAGIGIIWGMFIGTLIGCSLRLKCDQDNATKLNNDCLEDNLMSLVSENMEKDKEIERLKKEVDSLKCDETANERLILKLKEELKNITEAMYRIDIKLESVENENQIYRRELEEIQNTLYRTPIRNRETMLPPHAPIRKRHRTLSYESDETH